MPTACPWESHVPRYTGPAGSKAAADLLLEFSSEDLTRAVESDLTLRGQIQDVLAAVEPIV